MPFVPAVIGLSVAGALAHAVFHRNSSLFGSVISRLRTTGNQVALTFDDGPNPDATPRILDVLAECGVPATFFILGSHAERWPELVARIADEGHTVGNHGYFHRKLHLKSPRYVRRDIELGTRAIERSGAARPRLFRAPHGFRNPWVTSIAASLGMQTVGWSLGVRDTDRPGEEKIAERVVRGARPGSILLLHDGDGYDPYGDRLQTAAALPRIISGLRNRNFDFVPLAL